MSRQQCVAQLQRVLWLVQRAKAAAEVHGRSSTSLRAYAAPALRPAAGFGGAAPPSVQHARAATRARRGAACASGVGDATPAAAVSEPPTAAAPRAKKKLRLDALAMELYPQYSRTLIQSWILQARGARGGGVGKVLCGGGAHAC
jgi:hypothetical protein